MKIFSSTSRLFFLAAMAISFGTSVHAQATRTWVSGVGDDVNPCSRTAPCKTFAGAISKTAAGGEIDALDDGGFGAVTITKSITINGGGHIAGVLVAGAGVNGIIINAGANDVVVLRGLSFTGISGALNAVRYLAGRYVVVENCTIEGFSNGINMITTVVDGRMDIRNVRMTNATTTTGTYGIHVGASNPVVSISNTTVRGYTYGVTTRGGVTYMRGTDLLLNDIGYSNQGGALYSFGDNMLGGNANTDPAAGPIPVF